MNGYVAEVEFPKGNGEAHDETFIVFINIMQMQILLLMEHQIKTLRADTGGGTVDVWDIIYFIQRTYKA